MRQSPLLEFSSSAFAVSSSEDEQTNPGIYGKSLAEWLAKQLNAQGIRAGHVIAEDFGWCVPLESKPHKLFIACANREEAANKWQVFLFVEGGIMARLLGKDKSGESLSTAFEVVKQVLKNSSQVQDLHEEVR